MDAKFCVFGIACVLSVHSQWVPKKEFCRTPDGETGNCILLSSCKPITDTLQEPISREMSDLLKSHHCGFYRNQPKTCCPSNALPASGGPPDVSRHRNLSLLPRACGKLYLGDKIAFGYTAKLFEFPWMALISHKTNRGPMFKCGGTIINNRYVLTAAHCITQALMGVRIGEHNINTKTDCQETKEGERICSPPYQDLAIEEIIPHPNFNPDTFANDIGLLRVRWMDLARGNTYPVCLPLDKNRNYNFTDRYGVVTGWGTTEFGHSSPELQKVDLPILTNQECARLYEDKRASFAMNERQLCAGGKTKNSTCTGDSGGPLHVMGRLYGRNRMVQQGIVSVGPNSCGVESLPVVYTRVAYYMDWILDNMRA